MSEAYPRYFRVDGHPVKVVVNDTGTDVLALDLGTGAMVSDPCYRDRTAGAQVDQAAYVERLDQLRQPIVEGYATTALRWESTGDNDEPYRLSKGGHELTIRMGDFPAEALYLMHIDGQGVFAIDDWPAACGWLGYASERLREH